MKELSIEQQYYCDDVEKIIQKDGLLEQGFINVFGKENQDCIRGSIQNLAFHVVRLSKDSLTVLLHNKQVESKTLFKTIFYKMCDLLRIEDKELNSILSKYSFFDHFSYDFFLQLPFFQVRTLSLEERKEFISFLCDKRVYTENIDFFWTVIPYLLEKKKYEFKDLFDQYNKTLVLSEKIKKEILEEKKFELLETFQEKHVHFSLELKKKFKDKDFQRYMNDTTGMHSSNSFHGEVSVNIYENLHTWFHEFGHELFEERLCNCEKKFWFLNISSTLIDTQGIFSSNEIVAFEVFNDYFALKAIESFDEGKILNWNYGIKSCEIYAKYFPIVDELMKSLKSLFFYAYFHHQSNLVKQVVGIDNFSQYTALFREKMSPELLKKATCIVSKMVSHASNYEPNYYDTVMNYISELEGSGQKVRVLKPSMEKLKMDEKAISSMFDGIKVKSSN